MPTEIPYKDIFLLILPAIIAYLIWTVQHQKEKIRDIENQLSDKKYDMYSKIIHMFFDITMADKLGEKLSENDLIKKGIEIKKDMYLYAPDNVFIQYKTWLSRLETNENIGDSFKDYFKLITLIRKDMGNTATKITLDDFMLFYMQSEKEYNLFKANYNW